MCDAICVFESFFCILHHIIRKGNTVYQRTIVIFFLSGATFAFIYLVQKEFDLYAVYFTPLYTEKFLGF